jgi:DNA-binding Xre family transcriptional regulator
MLNINVEKILRLRGIENHYNFLVNLGIVPSTARNFLRDDVVLLRLEQIEKICVALNCTPNDLFEWTPNPNQPVAETHSLNAIRRRPERDLPALLNEVPLDKFEQIVDILQELKNKKE